jgi:hypothetical protein
MTPTTMPTETPTTTPTMTPTPQPTAIPQPELSVTFRDFHYECQGFRAWTQHYPPNQTVQGYRSFQTLMVVTNNSQNKTLDPPWRPDRWIVTDGNTEWEETYMWQWGPARGEPYELPPVEPGATASWTWLCYPLPQNAWVKSVEFTAWGRTYYFQFPKPSYGDHNYYNCP